MKMAGIYRVRVERGTKPPAFYIGQAVNMHRRKLEHLRGHRTGERLLLAFQKYGPGALEFSVLLVCAPDMLTTYEQAVLDYHLRRYGQSRVLNLQIECVRSNQGLKHRPESIAKMKARPVSVNSLQGLRSPNRLVRLREKLAGKPKVHSPETIAKIAATLTGKKQSAELIERRVASLRGRKQTPEQIAKRVASRLANTAARRSLDGHDQRRSKTPASAGENSCEIKRTRNA